MTPSTPPPSVVREGSDAAASLSAVETGAVEQKNDGLPTGEPASDRDLASGGLIKAAAVLALLGIGSFFLVKPLIQALYDDQLLPLPRRVVANRQNLDWTRISSSPSGATAGLLDAEAGNVVADSGDSGSAGFSDPTVPTRELSGDGGQADTAAEQVRLIPPGAQQPGVIAPTASAAMPSAPSLPSASIQGERPNSNALRRTVRNLVQSLPGQRSPEPSQPSQTIARSLPLPEEPYLLTRQPDSRVPQAISPQRAPGSSFPSDGQPENGQPVTIPIQPPVTGQPGTIPPTASTSPSTSSPQPGVVLPQVQPPTTQQDPGTRPAQPQPNLQPLPTPPVVSAQPSSPAPATVPAPNIPSLPGSTSDLDSPILDDPIAILPPPERPPIPDEIDLNGFNVTGSTVFSPEELVAVAQEFLQDDNEASDSDRPDDPQTVSIAQLIQASDRITQRYVDAGYISSGAIIPEGGIQPDGTVNIQVIEGRLESIDVARSPNRQAFLTQDSNNFIAAIGTPNRQQSLLNHPLSRYSPLAALREWLFPEVSRDRLLITGNRDLGLGYVRRRLARAGSAPLNLNRLLAGVQLLQTDPLIETVSTEIQDGTATGTNILEVDVVEAPTTSAQITVSNSRSPSIGSIQQRASLAQGNFLGFGDRLTLGANRTEGSDGWDVSYTIPINARNGTFGFAYSNSSSEVIEEPFTILDIQSESRSYEFTLRQPFVQTATEELAVSLTGSRRETKSEFLASSEGGAEPFPSTGADANGETNISAIRFAQDWTRQTSSQVFALRSEFSVGLGALDSTINPIRPDSRFFSWRGQGQWVRRIGSDSLFLLRGDIQLADGPLVPGEQFSLGGQGTVRGFRQDTLLTDNGWLASAEFRIPVLRVPKVSGELQLTPFIEIGQGWNPKEPDPPSNTLASTGLGLLWRMGDRFSSRLDWGIPLLGDTASGGSSLQEDGLHFSIQFFPF